MIRTFNINVLRDQRISRCRTVPRENLLQQCMWNGNEFKIWSFQATSFSLSLSFETVSDGPGIFFETKQKFRVLLRAHETQHRSRSFNFLKKRQCFPMFLKRWSQPVDKHWADKCFVLSVNVINFYWVHTDRRPRSVEDCFQFLMI